MSDLALALDSTTGPLELARLAGSDDSDVRGAVALHKACPAPVLARLSSDSSREVRGFALRNPACPTDVFAPLDEPHPGMDFDLARARAKTTDAATLDRLSKSTDPSVRAAVACSANVRSETLEQLTGDSSPFVAKAACANPNSTGSVLDAIERMLNDAEPPPAATPPGPATRFVRDTGGPTVPPPAPASHLGATRVGLDQRLQEMFEPGVPLEAEPQQHEVSIPPPPEPERVTRTPAVVGPPKNGWLTALVIGGLCGVVLGALVGSGVAQDYAARQLPSWVFVTWESAGDTVAIRMIAEAGIGIVLGMSSAVLWRRRFNHPLAVAAATIGTLAAFVLLTWFVVVLLLAVGVVAALWFLGVQVGESSNHG